MNYRMIGKSIGNLLLVEAACMLPSLLISLIYPESDATAFAAAIALTTAAGFLLFEERRIRHRRTVGKSHCGVHSACAAS